MQVIQLKGSDTIYSSNAFLVLGEWNAVSDVTTLVDVGADPAMADALDHINTGVGKKKIDRVVLTHTHSDHTLNLNLLRKRYHHEVLAFSPYFEGVDRVLKNGEMIRMGERWFEVIHMPGHSDDSIVLYNSDEGVLFAGDTPLVINSPGGTYNQGFVQALKALCRKHVKVVYSGHGDPLWKGAREVLRHSLENVLNSAVNGADDYDGNSGEMKTGNGHRVGR